MNNDDAREKGEGWLRYGFWAVAILVAVIAIYILVNVLGDKATNFNAPSGYKFVVEDHYALSGNGWATYYVYDNYILVKKDSEDNKNEPATIYDGIDSSKLSYNENDTVKTCDADSCYAYPKVLNTIKKLIANKFGREYTGN